MSVLEKVATYQAALRAEAEAEKAYADACQRKRECEDARDMASNARHHARVAMDEALRAEGAQ